LPNFRPRIIVSPASAHHRNLGDPVPYFKIAKSRADQLLVEQGLAESRAKAQAMILAGVVSCAGRRIDKPGEQLAGGAALSVTGPDHPWVSRGGVKLAHALDHFGIGGFTDVLLSRGARCVHAVDVGHGQLAWKLRQDPRVVVHERLNARYLSRNYVPEPVDLITCDASFIGLATVLPAALALAAEEAELVALVKPQFEAGREHVGKGGVVRDPIIQREVCESAAAWVAAQPGWTVVGVVESPILGPHGNREFLLYARRGGFCEEEIG
jgi:23S rRNA (cytidine1920-2'-O)/16S rRNA (cytidine1409-2'-O)-methyltransferase